MDSAPYMSFNFVDLLQSQQDSGISSESSPIPLFGTQATEGSNFEPDSPVERTSRRTWTPTDDIVLISSWLNTSKDPVKRIASYYSASPKIAESEKREASHCKQRWHKINDLVCKFCGAFEAATRGSRRRKFEDGAEACSEAKETKSAVGDEGTTRPIGVKAAKARGKKLKFEGKELSEFQTMWRIKQEDLTIKEKLSKMKLIDSLIAKQEPLADYEEALKKKLINELLL
ncbi:hypothetical protein N665_0346s0010 [Sinapis alba]|nr:hypothetical protein N665_0346s0010 [Sinapis alba]